MSLISQNVATKRRVAREKEKDDNVAEKSLPTESEEMGLADNSVPASLKKKKRSGIDSSSKVQQSEVAQGEEMKKLENLLFASLYSPLEFGNEAEYGKEELGAKVPLFFMDKSAGVDMMVYEGDVEAKAEGKELIEERKPVWVDDEEEMTEVDITKVNRLRKLRKDTNENVVSGREYVSRLRAQHVRLNPGTEWAQFNSSTKHDSDDENESNDGSGVTIAQGYEDLEDDSILRSNDSLIVNSRTKLLPGLLEYSRLVDANVEDPSNGPINSVQFHRNAQLLLAAGLDRRLRFFQVDGKRNTKIESIYIEDCPIRKASFLPDGSQVIIGGRRKFFYSFDLVKAMVDKIGPLTGREEKSLENFEVSPDSSTIAFVGNEGYILLVSSRTKELIGTLKMNGTARALAFADEGQQLLSSGGDGHIYHWDLRTRKCIHKAVDEGCITGSALCTSPDSSMFASGSSSGLVNVYKREEFLGGKRRPVKSIENLTSNVGYVKFNHDAQILAICSGMKRNGLKLVHIPSFNVFSNWPARTSLQYPRCFDFSPGGGFFTVGNAAGKVLLYKLHHYQNA